MRAEVGRFSSLSEAQIVAGFLRSQGVDAEVLDTHYGSTEPYLIFALGWFRVSTPETQADGARLLLQAVTTAAALPADDDPPPRPAGPADWATTLFSLLVSWWAGAPMVRRRWRRA